MRRKDAATQEQIAHIEDLTKQARLGTHSSHGIKAILGKHPVGGLGKDMANEVIQALDKRIARSGGVPSRGIGSEAG